MLAESMEVAEDLALEDGSGSIAQLHLGSTSARGRVSWAGRFSAAAAAALTLVATVVVWQNAARQRPPGRVEWLAEMPPAKELLPHVWGGVVLRGEGDPGSTDRQAAELGALLVDVEVALGAEDAERTRDILYRMATIVDEAGFMADDVAELRAIAEEKDVTRMKAAFAERLPGFEQHLRERFDEFFLRLGTFAEEAHVAARTGNADFLGSRRSRRYIGWLLSQHERPLDDDVREALVTLAQPASDPPQQAEAAMTILRSLTG